MALTLLPTTALAEEGEESALYSSAISLIQNTRTESSAAGA